MLLTLKVLFFIWTASAFMLMFVLDDEDMAFFYGVVFWVFAFITGVVWFFSYLLNLPS